ncbi:MAG: beta-propeller fold lactonase family protein [Spirochaetales bacterium]|nr:beta-propeller fold lactonase family protein [Spirochaetales bacterium]
MCKIAKLKKQKSCFITAAVVCLVSLLLFCSCSYSYKIMISPTDASLFVGSERVIAGKQYATAQNMLKITAGREGYEEYNRTYTLKDLFATQEITVELNKKQFQVEIKLVNGNARYSIDDSLEGTTPFKGTLAYGTHTLVLKKGDLPEQATIIDVIKNEVFVFRYQNEKLPVRQIGIFPCGSAPKQLNFSPDNRYLFISLLGGEGFQIFDMRDKKIIANIKVGKRPDLTGFPEGLFIEHTNCFLISQMTTDSLFEYQVFEDGSVSFKRSLETGGIFCKFMAYNRNLDLLAVSNWCSNDVSLIKYDTGKVERLLKGLSTPRGVAFDSAGTSLYIASFEGGNIFKYSTATWREVKRFYRKNAAMRHIVLSNDEKRIFVSDMYNCAVYELDTGSFQLLHAYDVYYNPNTIDVSSDSGYLFVSCRGPNNPKSYELRSPVDGKVMIFNTRTKELAATIQGGNQPTGLDVSGDDRYLVFSNFLDANFEIWDVTGLLGKD